MRWLLFLGVVPVAAAFQAFQEPAPLQGDPARGRRVFIRKQCVECHAVLGSGGKVGPDLSQVGKGRSFYELVGQLWQHSPRMIESMADKKVKWPTFKIREMADLISYLYYLNYFGKPGDYKKGKKAFTEKACALCHSIGGQGGDRGPNLDAYGAAASSVKMVTAMWNHGPNMVTVQKDLNLEPSRFDGSEVADILAYLKASTTKLNLETEYLSPGHPQKGRIVF
ncbi:MAG: c-type cytochrome, partial [Planctomycetota bacterium]